MAISKNSAAAIRADLKSAGYARVNSLFATGRSRKLMVARRAFIRSIHDLPIDTHSLIGNRYRRYGVFDLNSQNNKLTIQPPVWNAARGDWVTRYRQDAQYNSEYEGKVRSFSSLTEGQRTNQFITWLILKCVRCLPWSKIPKSIVVGVHIIQLCARYGTPAASTPDFLHRDGEPWTWAFLLERVAVEGGQNTIAVPSAINMHPRDVSDDRIVDQFTLRKRFEGWVVNDQRVSHYVSPVSVAGGRSIGWRTVLLIEYSKA
ncbi:2OG-Fe dioxygenase family protein [Bradyrhizobium sp.]